MDLQQFLQKALPKLGTRPVNIKLVHAEDNLEAENDAKHAKNLSLRCTHKDCRANVTKKTKKDKPSKIRNRTQYFCHHCSTPNYKFKSRAELTETKQLAMFCNQGQNCCYSKHIAEMCSAYLSHELIRKNIVQKVDTIQNNNSSDAIQTNSSI